jgi:hypothetical protein
MGPDGSWTTPVQYRYNKRLELSFVSLIGAKHVANILRDSRVSAAIYYPEQFASGGSLGLQLKGKARTLLSTTLMRSGKHSRSSPTKCGASIRESLERE